MRAIQEWRVTMCERLYPKSRRPIPYNCHSSTAEIKQVKNCKTRNNIWAKVKQIYQFKGPPKKPLC